MRKKLLAFIVAIALVAAPATLLSGCGKGSEDAISVQSVSMITGVGNTGIADRFAGVVTSSNVLSINKGSDQKIVKLNVKVGDEVHVGDVLFSYDEQSLQLAYDKLVLEKEQYTNLAATMRKEIESLEKKVTGGTSATQLEYSIQLQTLQIDLKETEYKLATIDDDIEEAKKMLSKADVVSTIDGRVQTINEEGQDSEGNPSPYMTIVETGAFRVKGVVSELNLKDMYAGAKVVVRSRVDSEAMWTGIVDEIKLDSPESDNEDFYGYSDASDEYVKASKYPFFVKLDDAAGLILGQHVYIEPDFGQSEALSGLWLPSYYICDADTKPYVWAEGKFGRLTKKTIELGAYDADSDSYEILSGVTEDDYIAFPDDTCAEGVRVNKYDEESFGVQTDDFISDDFSDDTFMNDDFSGEAFADDVYANDMEVNG